MSDIYKKKYIDLLEKIVLVSQDFGSESTKLVTHDNVTGSDLDRSKIFLSCAEKLVDLLKDEFKK